MGYTRFGEFVRLLRIKHHEVMGDMAKLLETSTPFLSAVETGKKNVPKGWIPVLVKHYSLSKDEELELLKSIEESKTQMKISLSKSGIMQRRAAIQFARSFDDMDEETAKKIMKLLEGGD